MTSLPNQIDNPRHKFEVLKLFTAVFTRAITPILPAAVGGRWVVGPGRPSDCAQAARILPGSSFVSSNFDDRPEKDGNFWGSDPKKTIWYQKIDVLSGIPMHSFSLPMEQSAVSTCCSSAQIAPGPLHGRRGQLATSSLLYMITML